MTNDCEITRRDFLKSGAKAGATMAALGGIGFMGDPQRVLGANDRIRIAVCGVHGRGFDHVRQFSRIPGVEVAAICEVAEDIAHQRMAEMERLQLPKPAYYFDVRELLEDKTIDAISVATPNHWHSLIGVWACQAGKDVYVEKPCSHNWWEGKQLVEAAKRYQRIVQHGTQSRSSTSVREAIQKLHSGLVGDVYLARGLCYKWRPSIGHMPIQPVPPRVHYNLWLGPAPVQPFTLNHFLYNWHWFWDTGNGDLGNQGIHELDVARWGLGVGFPNKVAAIGGKVMFDDDQQTPNVLNCAFEFDQPTGPPKLLEFEVRGWITNHEAGIGTGAYGGKPRPLNEVRISKEAELGATPGHPILGPIGGMPGTVGNIYYGAKGMLGISGYSSYKSWVGIRQEPGPQGRGGNELAHFENFIQCVRSRKAEDLNAPIEEGHISCTLLHLANASYRLGRSLRFNPDTQHVIDDDDANAMMREAARGYRRPFYIPEEV